MNKVRARAATALAIALGVVSGTVSAATAAGTGAVRADIRADVNRDGTVDVTGESDVVGKTAWNSGRGAIFLPNLGDKQRRCKTRTPDGRWLSNARLEACNDAQGTVVRAPEYLAPLRTVPADDVSDAATGSLHLVGTGKSRVRLFLKRATPGPTSPPTPASRLLNCAQGSSSAWTDGTSYGRTGTAGSPSGSPSPTARAPPRTR